MRLVKVLETFEAIDNNILLSALGTSGFSKFINMKILDIKQGKERQRHITKQLVYSFSVNIRNSQP